MEKWKWNPDNWRSDGFAATKLRNTLLFSLFEVKMNVFRRRILVFQVHISENFRLRQIFISSYTIFHKTTKNSYTEIKKITGKSYKKKMANILIRIPYKGGRIKVCDLRRQVLGPSVCVKKNLTQQTLKCPTNLEILTPKNCSWATQMILQVIHRPWKRAGNA